MALCRKEMRHSRWPTLSYRQQVARLGMESSLVVPSDATSRSSFGRTLFGRASLVPDAHPGRGAVDIATALFVRGLAYTAFDDTDGRPLIERLRETDLLPAPEEKAASLSTSGTAA